MGWHGLSTGTPGAWLHRWVQNNQSRLSGLPGGVTARPGRQGCPTTPSGSREKAGNRALLVEMVTKQSKLSDVHIVLWEIKCLWFHRSKRNGHAAEQPAGTVLLWKPWSWGEGRGKSPHTTFLGEAQASMLCSDKTFVTSGTWWHGPHLPLKGIVMLGALHRAEPVSVNCIPLAAAGSFP